MPMGPSLSQLCSGPSQRIFTSPSTIGFTSSSGSFLISPLMLSSLMSLSLFSSPRASRMNFS
jgi:hypothetical protein